MPAIETAFTALRIEGGLFPAEFLQRIAAFDAPGQSPADYGVLPGLTLRDEIGRYWTVAEALWKDYRQSRQRTDIPPEQSGIERWLLRLLRDVLGYADITQASWPTVIGERTFPISHRACGGALPLLLTTADRELDRSNPAFGEDGRRRAPHAAMQELLNADTTAKWGMLANGSRLRLLRENPSLTRPSYIEVDVERIFEERLYSDFAAFWLLAQASRLAPDPSGASGGRIEQWRLEGAKTGQRALDRLRAGVTTALRELGSGFIEHLDNEALRADLNGGAMTANGLHQQLLRLVYRLLFLFTAEERDLLHGPDADPIARNLYAEGYSLASVRDRARLRRSYDRFSDLWSGLTVTFRGLARGADPLGLPALGGLFEDDQCPALDHASLPNSRLLAAIHALAFFTAEGSLQRVNYRDMGTEELGSVYESLLELHPVVQVSSRPWTFGFLGDEGGADAKGSERRLSGSYYTPDALVQELLRSALDPIIDRAVRDNPADPRSALLHLRVLDPACGSGHFLLGAARRLADAVARLDSESDLPDEALRRRALREVVRRCLFGVDRNPLSVELCKAALWIEAIEPGKPLTFLDAHIKCGDSLIGIADLSVLAAGIPDEAFKDLTGDDKGYARDMRKRNKTERDNPTLSLLPQVALPPDLAAAISAMTDAPEETLAAIAEKRRALIEIQSGRAAYDLRVACDLWCAAFFAPKATRPELRGRELVPTTDAVWRYLKAPSVVYGPLIGAVEELRTRLRFFHWPMEFPDAFIAGGFDCVLGNPPWEVLQLSEDEYFESRRPDIASLMGARRKAAIKALAIDDPELWKDYQFQLRSVEAANQYIRGCKSYPLTTRGKLNTYALFAERSLAICAGRGMVGLILPTGIATDDGNKAFFDQLSSENRIRSFFDFENKYGLFPAVHRTTKFVLLTIGQGTEPALFSFYMTDAEQLKEESRKFPISRSAIELINPNTRTCPIFRSMVDFDLTRNLYSRVPILIKEGSQADNPWEISYRKGLFNMTTDSGIFLDGSALAESGFIRNGNRWIDPSGSKALPLIEAKMLDFYDHRAASYQVNSSSRGNRVLPGTAIESHTDLEFVVEPYYWVREGDVVDRLNGHNPQDWLIGFGDITTPITERSFVPTAFPKAGVGDTVGLILLARPGPEIQYALLLANLSSIVLDYLARQKIGRLHINSFVLKQLPIFPPKSYDAKLAEWICVRVLELTYTAYDMRAWATDLGFKGAPFVWDENRRSQLRADLDAAYAYLYGLTRDELRYILDPADIYGSAFPSETFRVLKEREMRQYGEYRTARHILASWDRLTADGTFQSWGTVHIKP